MDQDGVITLVLTIAIGIVLAIIYVRKEHRWEERKENGTICYRKEKGFKGIWNVIEKDPNFPEKIIVVIPLIVVSFVALWLTIRVVGLYTLRRYLDPKDYVYATSNILEIVGYILSINLCLTLIRSRELPEILKAAIQSVLIGIITSVPSIGAVGGIIVFLTSGAGFQFALFMIGMAATLIALVFVRRHIVEREGKRTENT